MDLGLQEKWAGGQWASQWWGPEGPREVEPQTQGPQTSSSSSTQRHATQTRPGLLAPSTCGVTAQASWGLPTLSASWSESLGLPALRVDPPELWPLLRRLGRRLSRGAHLSTCRVSASMCPAWCAPAGCSGVLWGTVCGSRPAGGAGPWAQGGGGLAFLPSFRSVGSRTPGQEHVPARGAHAGSHVAQSSAHRCVPQDHTGPSR